MNEEFPGVGLYSGEMMVRSEPTGLSAARRQIVSVARSLEFSLDEVDDLLLAVGEAVTNAYVHGTPEPGKSMIYLGWHCEGDTLTVMVKDEGLDASRIPLAKQRVKRLGLGIELMRRVVDDVDIRFDGGTTVTLKKRNRSIIRQ
ncbi:MAG: ATP-binding protein [Armatimonadota bacterium]